MNWQHFMRFLASIRGRWDLAILANLTEGSSRPTELPGCDQRAGL